ncbi:hypothetical protein [Streptodolium elevatio]|uniref:Uncharacterized protein n=1 Tax=Streptodolium elevatio TaxID=3157996 RepID=A0ABV3DM03_9ACTN
MTDTVTSLLWYAGPALGAEILGRLGAPVRAGRRGPAEPTLPPALLEHAVRNGVADGIAGVYDRSKRQAGASGNADIVLRLLELDDPQVNAALFEKSSWAALRQAVLSQARFAPKADDDTPVPLAPAVRQAVLGRGSRGDVQAALSAADPELAFWALINGFPGGAHGGVYARLTAAMTLVRNGRWAQLRRVHQVAPFELPPETPEDVVRGLAGSGTFEAVERFLIAEYGADRFCAKLQDALRTAHGRTIVRDVLEPPWTELAARHAADPLPWGAAVALLEHTRCPREFQASLLAAHPRAVQSVARPGPEALRVCLGLGEDQFTKKVLLHGVTTGGIDAAQLVAEVRPARLAVTALTHGGIEAVATQAAAARLVRSLLVPLVTEHPGAWRALYTALPEFDGTVAELLASMTAVSHPAGRTGEPPAELPRPGRQAAWAYAVLVGLVDAEHASHALDFLDDLHLAPVAGSRELPQSVADHVCAHGGPVSRRVLAGNPAVRVDLIETLVLGGDRTIASAAYRNPRCPMALRQYILSVDGIDDELRTELLEESRAERLWPLLASTDAALLRHVAWASVGELGKWARLRAAYRLAELHGVGALEDVPDDEEVTAARSSGLRVLDARLRECDAQWLKVLTQTTYLPYRREAGGVHGALADPGLDWRAVIAAARRREINEAVLHELSQRPDCPMELSRVWRGAHAARKYAVGVGRSAAVLRHRPVALEILAEGPEARFDAATALDGGSLTAEEYLAAGNAADVVDTGAASAGPLARLVARVLQDGLGDAVDAWVVVARLLVQRPTATLGELVATARAAA